MTRDDLDLDYTTDNKIAVQRFNHALGLYLGSSTETMAAIDAITELDAEMPMAMLFRGYLLKLAADPIFKPLILQIVTALENRKGLNDREIRHTRALRALVDGQLISAAQLLDELVELYPRDMLALRIAHYLHFYCGGATQMLESLDVALMSWQPGDPYYGYLKGMHSFALEESGQYAQAEDCGLEALDYNRADIWATHAVTHTYQMQAQFNQGIPFIESYEPEWATINNFANHMHWHKALQFLGNKQYDEALALYDEKLITPLQDNFYLDVCNSASLLWRLEMLGINVGDRWEALRSWSTPRVTDDELVFTTLHYLMAPARLGDAQSVANGLAHFESWASQHSTQGSVASSVGLDMARAIAAFGNQQFEQGAKLLAAVQSHIHLIGGSHAQRHLFDDLISTYQPT